MPYLSPPTMTRAEQQALLAASTEHPRDHLILSLALGSGLRLAEIVGLDVGDVFLPDALGPKLREHWRFKLRGGESVGGDDALFCSQSGTRISKRRVQLLFKG